MGTAEMKQSENAAPSVDTNLTANRHTPEQKLWRACLLEAFRVATGRGTALQPQDPSYARRWFFRKYAPCKEPPIGSFEWICLALNLDPDYARQHIRIILPGGTAPKKGQST